MSKERVYRKLIVDLLNCAELNQEDLESDTLELLQEAESVLMSDDEDEEVLGYSDFSDEEEEDGLDFEEA